MTTLAIHRFGQVYCGRVSGVKRYFKASHVIVIDGKLETRTVESATIEH